MTITPQVSVLMNSAYRGVGGDLLPMRATLTGRTLHLRVSLLCGMKVDVDELREALGVLEASASGPSEKEKSA